MASKEDMLKAIEDKRAEINDKGLDQYYGLPDKYEIREAYHLNYIDNNLIKALEYTKDPKYVKLANFLIKAGQAKPDDREIKKAEVLLKREYIKDVIYDSDIKIIYDEMKKIEKRAQKVDRRNARKLRRFKDVRKFVENDMRALATELFSSNIEWSEQGLIEYFNNCPQLAFVNTSKLTKRVK